MNPHGPRRSLQAVGSIPAKTYPTISFSRSATSTRLSGLASCETRNRPYPSSGRSVRMKRRGSDAWCWRMSAAPKRPSATKSDFEAGRMLIIGAQAGRARSRPTADLVPPDQVIQGHHVFASRHDEQEEHQSEPRDHVGMELVQKVLQEVSVRDDREDGSQGEERRPH